MKALNHKSCIAVVVLITLLAIAGCQSGSNAQPTETVVAEGEANCPVMDFVMEDGVDFEDPELGPMSRGNLVSWRFDCPDPYIKGKWFGWQDFYSPDGGDTWYWNGYAEGITDEGGVWIGTADNKPPTALGTWKGEGKYKGLQISTEWNMDTNLLKYRITKLIEE